MVDIPIGQEWQEGIEAVSDYLLGLKGVANSTGDQPFLSWLSDSGLDSLIVCVDVDQMEMISVLEGALANFSCTSPLIPGVRRQLDIIGHDITVYEIAGLRLQIARAKLFLSDNRDLYKERLIELSTLRRGCSREKRMENMGRGVEVPQFLDVGFEGDRLVDVRLVTKAGSVVVLDQIQSLQL